MTNLLAVLLSLAIVAEAFMQRIDTGAASGLMIAALVPALLFLMSQFIYFTLHFGKSGPRK